MQVQHFSRGGGGGGGPVVAAEISNSSDFFDSLGDSGPAGPPSATGPE